MSVPPSKRGGGTPSAKGPPDQNDNGKSFQLPGRKAPVQGQEEKDQKKKGLFDLAGEEPQPMKQQPLLQPDIKATGAAAEISPTQAQQQVSQIAQLISKMVDTMRVGQVGGKEMVSLDLKTTPEVPSAFAGSNLTLSYKENGLAIHFDNFMSPQQQNTAIIMVEQNKEQLQQMIVALNAKNIQVAELSIGTQNIALPRVEPLPPPFQAGPAAQPDTRQQRERGGEEGGGQQPGGGGRQR